MYTAHAQLSVGVLGGANFARQKASNAFSDWEIGYHAGVAVNLYIAEFSFGGFAIQPEVLYSTKGTSWDLQTTRLSYIEVPLGFIYLYNFGKVVPYISVAPYYAFLLTQKEELQGQISTVNKYKNGDYGLKLGGGVELQRFQLSAAYSLGLCDISKEGSGIYSRTVEVSLGYFFLR